MKSESGKIYVTGVAGMIGSNTARSLLEAGEYVIGIDNYWRGRESNIEDLMTYKDFVFRHADLIADRDWYIDMKSDDVLIHVADIVAGIGYVFSNEWSVFQKNVLINTNVARVISERKPAHLIYLGTACSYPQQMQRSVEHSVLKESDKYPADPESGYGWSKLMGEIEFSLAVKDSGVRLTVLDLHNVYGWPCTYNDETAQVIPALIWKAISASDGKLLVWGDGRQGRAFLHVSDVTSAVQRVIKYKGKEKNFMIGPDKCTSIADIAEIVCAHPNIDTNEIVFDLTKPTGDLGRYANFSLAAKELGWAPKVDLRAGVHNLIDRIIDDRK